MKRLIFLLSILLLVGCVSAQTDTASVFIFNLPSTTKIDSQYIGITESPTTTYKVTWKQQQRNLNWNLLLKALTAYGDDYLAITHRNAGKDTIKAIKLSDFYKTLLKDSVESDIGTAETEIYSKIDSLDDALTAEIALKATVTKANQLSDSLETAYSEILLKASTARVNSTRDSLYTAISLKASVSQYNQVSDSLETAFAQILLEAHNRHVGDSTLTASISLKVSANDVYSLLEILPDSVKIQSDNILLDGNVIADSLLYAKNLSLANLYTIDATNWIGLNAGNIWFNNFYFGSTTSKSLSRNGNGNDLIWDGNAVLTAGNVGSYALTSYMETDPGVYSWAKASTKPTYTYSEISGTPDLSNYVTTSTEGWRTTDVTGLGNGIGNSAGSLYVKASSGLGFSGGDLVLNLNSANLEINGSAQLSVKDGAVNPAAHVHTYSADNPIDIGAGLEFETTGTSPNFYKQLKTTGQWGSSTAGAVTADGYVEFLYKGTTYKLLYKN